MECNSSRWAYEWARDIETGATVLLAREGNDLFIGFNMPEPDGPLSKEMRKRLTPYRIPEGKQFGPSLAFELLGN